MGVVPAFCRLLIRLEGVVGEHVDRIVAQPLVRAWLVVKETPHGVLPPVHVWTLILSWAFICIGLTYIASNLELMLFVAPHSLIISKGG